MICEGCGSTIEQDTGINVICPICGGTLISEAEDKERREINEALSHEEFEPNPFEKKEETEITDEQLKKNMAEDLFAFGDEGLWLLIEDIPNCKDRIKYRNVFFDIGGKVPTKEKEMDI